MTTRPIRCGNDRRTQLTPGDLAEVERYAAHLTESEQPQPPVVCICGSTRFQQQMAEAAHVESLAGRIVVMPHVSMKQWDGEVEDMDQVKTGLDRLHRAKIRMAREILVVGDYVGDSTRAEIEYARCLGLPVRFTHPEVDPVREA
ncbi:hypothetical protein [Streptacidiphilus fuscans]|uniref:Uncharacterized protein n=1 Tax=Streptacidiphilus fuscans TaxID=2789292 RepID=A0A931FBA8_9ACTN|nr:hypothetical protein [Streptacidiphilus fuscans]MBF9067248.1 hypothetical protein [Streptacidiphilus fuscans]